MKCQHEIISTETEETSGGRWVDYQHTEPCDKPVLAWRECGAGCKKVLAFCTAHGGDGQAIKLMMEHIQEEHAPAEKPKN